MSTFFLKNLSEIDLEKDIIQQKRTVIGLDVGDKTVGIAVSDRRIKIASGVTLIKRKKINQDFDNLFKSVISYNPKLIIFGWPLQTNGIPGIQCEKILKFIEGFYLYISSLGNKDPDGKNMVILKDIFFSKWDERFSTKTVNNIMIEADLSRKRRKEIIDKTAAIYILQGALDFLNRIKINH